MKNLKFCLFSFFIFVQFSCKEAAELKAVNYKNMDAATSNRKLKFLAADILASKFFKANNEVSLLKEGEEFTGKNIPQLIQRLNVLKINYQNGEDIKLESPLNNYFNWLIENIKDIYEIFEENSDFVNSNDYGNFIRQINSSDFLIENLEDDLQTLAHKLNYLDFIIINLESIIKLCSSGKIEGDAPFSIECVGNGIDQFVKYNADKGDDFFRSYFKLFQEDLVCLKSIFECFKAGNFSGACENFMNFARKYDIQAETQTSEKIFKDLKTAFARVAAMKKIDQWLNTLSFTASDFPDR